MSNGESLKGCRAVFLYLRFLTPGCQSDVLATFYLGVSNGGIIQRDRDFIFVCLGDAGGGGMRFTFQR